MRKMLFVGVILTGSLSVSAAQREFSHTVSVATLRVPAEARVHFERARQARLGGQTDRFDREIAKTLELDRSFAEAYVLRGSEEVEQRQYEAALTDSFLAEGLDRGAKCTKIVRVGALNGLRRFAEAWGVLEGMNAAEGQTWEAKYERTRAAVGLGDAAGALRWSAETLDVVPLASLDSARVLRGDALQMAGRYGEAAAMWQEYLASPRGQRYRAQVLTALARAERLAALQQVAALR